MQLRALLIMFSIPLAGLLGGCGTMGETYAHKGAEREQAANVIFESSRLPQTAFGLRAPLGGD